MLRCIKRLPKLVTSILIGNLLSARLKIVQFITTTPKLVTSFLIGNLLYARLKNVHFITTAPKLVTSILFFGYSIYFADRNYNAQQIYINKCKYCKLILAAADAADAEDPA